MKTINKFLLLLGGLAMTAGMTGCEDKRGENLEEYASRVYFRNGGNQTIPLYRVGKNTVYKIPVCKSGSDLSYTAEATVAVVEQSQLDIYNMENNSNYVQIPGDGTGNGPGDCFRFTTETKLHFAPGEISKVVEVELFTDDISFLQEANPKNEYVLALQVYSDRQVSPNINLLILEPDITIPVVSFTEAGLYRNDFNPDTPPAADVAGEVVLGMDDLWDADFTCKLGVHDQDWLNDYNEKNGTEYELMPSANYWLCDEQNSALVQFAANTNKASFNVHVDSKDMGVFREYVIPLYLEDCSVKYDDPDKTNVFKLDDKVFLVHAVYTPKLEKVTLTGDMLSTDYTSKAGGDNSPVSVIVDGKPDTYWHSEYLDDRPAGDPTYGVYIDIALGEGNELEAVQFRYQTRHNNGNGAPTLIRIGASNDGENWKLIQEVKEGLPGANNAWGELPVANAKAPYKYYRFGVATSKAGDCRTAAPSYTALGELELYGI